MENTEWKHICFDEAINSLGKKIRSRNVTLLVHAITPELFENILEDAYKNNCDSVYIDTGYTLPDCDDFFLAFPTNDEAVDIIRAKYANLGVSVGYYF